MLAQLPPIVPRAIGRSAAWARERKAMLVLAAAALCIIITAVVVGQLVDRRAPLFDGPLAAAQVGEVEQALTLWNEPFESNAQGTQLFVPVARRRDLLFRLVVAGLPRHYAPTSADVLQTPENPLTPESVIDDRRRAGIEGDLVAGLRRISGVADAAVVIAPSTGGPFDDESMRSPPTASVQLIIQPGARLSPATVSGVQRFVAAAYPGLSAQRVTVVDSGGFILNGMPAADRAASKESRVQTAIQTALDAVLGTGAAVVRVSARTSGTAESEQSTRVSPHGLLDAETGREHGTESGRAFDKEKTTRHFAYDTVVNHRSTAADSISRISVAVFLDARRVDTGKTAALTALVRAAAGADLRSGDEVVVQTLTFARRLEPAVRQSAGRLSTRLRAIVPAVALCIIVALGASIWPRVQELRLRPELSEATDLSRRLATERPHAAAHILRTLPTDLRTRVLDSWDARRRVAVQQVLDDSRYA